MFDKWTKKFASKATDNAIEGATQSLSDKLSQYMDYILPGLALGVVILGSHRITRNRETHARGQSYIPYNNGGQPITINNYYREREESYYERNQRRNYACIQNGQVRTQTQKTYSKR